MNNAESLTDATMHILLWGSLFAILIFVSYRRYIVSIFDPLNVQAISQVAACVVAVEVVDDPRMLMQLFASQVAFIVGFRLVRPFKTAQGTVGWKKQDMDKAAMVVGGLFLIILLANCWLGLTAGFPLFARDPSIAKVENFTGGLGLVRRLNSGAGTFLSVSSLVLAIKGHYRRLFTCIFAVSLAVAILGGAKGSLLAAVELIAYLTCRHDVVSEGAGRQLRIVSYCLFVLGTLLAVFILRASSNSWNDAGVALATRVMFFGDAVIYYYRPEVIQMLSHLGPWDYTTSLLNPVLGFFRLVEYQYPIGYQIVSFLNGEYLSVVQGPNTPFYVGGHIYFGSVGGIIYSGSVGYIVSRARRWYLTGAAVTPFRLSCSCTMAILIFVLPVEAPLFVSEVFDTFLPVMMIAGVVTLAFYSVHPRLPKIASNETAFGN